MSFNTWPTQIDPDPDALILVAVLAAASSPNTPLINGVTGCGLTWEEVDTQVYNRRRLSLFRAMGTPTGPGTLTFSFSGALLEDCAWKAVQITNLMPGSNGAVAIGASASAESAGTSVSVDLGVTPDQNDIILTVLGLEDNIDATAEASFTEIGARVSSANTRSLHLAYDSSASDDTPQWNYTGPTTSSATIAVHLLAAAEAPAPTVPATPTALIATAGDETASVSWSAPNNGGSAITSYTLTPYISGVAQTPITGILSTSRLVTGLTNGTAYTFKVIAINSIGSSSESAASNSVTPSGAPSGAPSTPSAPTIVAGNGELTLNWVAPNDGGSTITGYDIECTAVDTPGLAGQLPIPVEAWPDPVTVGNVLTTTIPRCIAGERYKFRIRATNINGDSSWSASSAYGIPTGYPGETYTVGHIVGTSFTNETYSAHSSDLTEFGGTELRSEYNGQVIQNRDFTGGVDFRPVHTGIIVKNCKLTKGFGEVGGYPNADVTYIDCTFTENPESSSHKLIRCSISVTENDSVSANGDCFISGSDITLNGYGEGSHADGIMVEGGSNVQIRRNRVRALNGATGLNAGIHISSGNQHNDCYVDDNLVCTAIKPLSVGAGVWRGNKLSDRYNTSTEGDRIYEYSGHSPAPTICGTTYYDNAGGQTPGAAVESNPACVSTVPEQPSAPTIVAGDGELTLNWVAPANGGSAITGYDIECTAVDTPGLSGQLAISTLAWPDPVTVGNVLTTTIPRCIGGERYKFRIRATNAVGDSTWSADSTYGIPTGYPMYDYPVGRLPGDPSLITNSATNLSTDDQIYEDDEFTTTGPLEIHAPGLIFRRCKFNGTVRIFVGDFGAGRQTQADFPVFLDCEHINASAATEHSGGAGVDYAQYQAYRCLNRGFNEAYHGTDIYVIGNYGITNDAVDAWRASNPVWVPANNDYDPPGPHPDWLQVWASGNWDGSKWTAVSTTTVQVRRNTCMQISGSIDPEGSPTNYGPNATIFVQGGNSSGIKVDDNLLYSWGYREFQVYGGVHRNNRILTLHPETKVPLTRETPQTIDHYTGFADPPLGPPVTSPHLVYLAEFGATGTVYHDGVNAGNPAT